MLVFLVLGGFGGSKKIVNLEFWGVFENPYSFEETIRNFKQKYPWINVTFRNFSYEEYENTLLNALASGRGPDIFMIHNTWLAKHKYKLAPLNQNDKELNYKLINFQQDFVDVAKNDLVDSGQIYSLPIYIDTLALYYNKDFFNSAGISEPPKTWDEFVQAVKLLTKIDDKGNIIKSGAAIGTARNINRSTDILMLLMLQSGVQMVDKERNMAIFAKGVVEKGAGEVALQFYTDFADPQKEVYTWNNNLYYSIDAFITERAAMMFNYSHHLNTIREKAPRLNFEVALMPQISGSEIRVDYANYFSPVVSIASKNQKEAWQFLIYLSSQEGVLPYLHKSKRPTARRDLIEFQKTDPDLGVFALQALSARNWYQVDNKAIEKIFADMIDDVVFKRKTMKEALETAENQVTILMQK